jgi:rhodanese-related sulfurtransferase
MEDGAAGSVVEVSAVDAINRIVDGVANTAVLVDVRQPSEWNAGHAPGSLHIPLDELLTDPMQLRMDRPIFVLCRSGRRSATAAQRLQATGHDAAVVTGGLQAWEAAGGRLLTATNRPGRLV